jgi:hypothetical protein
MERVDVSTTKEPYVTAADLKDCITISLTPEQVAIINEQQRKAEQIVDEELKKRLGPPSGKAELALALQVEGDDYIIVNAEVVITPDAPHNPETCRDPACHCRP